MTCSAPSMVSFDQSRSGTLRPALLTRMSSRPSDLDEGADALHLLRLHEVGRLHMRGAALRRDALRDALERFAPAPGQHDRGTFGGERQRGRLADAAARARHPGDLAGQMLRPSRQASLRSFPFHQYGTGSRRLSSPALPFCALSCGRCRACLSRTQAGSGDGGGNMRITGVETLQADAGWRLFSFLKITTDDGIAGWSEYNESFGSAGLSAVIDALAPHLIGKDPLPYRADRLDAARVHAAVARRPQPPGDRGDRERAARHQGQGARRAGLCAVRRAGARAHPGLLVALRHLPRAQRRDDGRAAASPATTSSRAMPRR